MKYIKSLSLVDGLLYDMYMYYIQNRFVVLSSAKKMKV